MTYSDAVDHFPDLQLKQYLKVPMKLKKLSYLTMTKIMDSV